MRDNNTFLERFDLGLHCQSTPVPVYKVKSNI